MRRQLVLVSFSLILVLVIAGGIGGYLWYQNKQAEEKKKAAASSAYQQNKPVAPAPSAAPVAAAPFTEMVFSRTSNANKCIDIASNGGKGANLQVYDCNGGEAQKFALDTSTGHLRAAKDKNLCVDPVGLNEASGTKLIMWDCHEGNKGWSYADKALRWRNKWCVDVPAGDDANGKQLQIWECLGNPNMQWNTKA